MNMASLDVQPFGAGTIASLTKRDTTSPGSGQLRQGIGIVTFLTSIVTSVVIFSAQLFLFILLRNKLARIFKPKTYLVPERERTDSPPRNFLFMLKSLLSYSDREVIKKCGLDAYFFLRYLKTLLIIFIPICAIVMPILIPLNYVGGKGHDIDVKGNSTTSGVIPKGLDTLAWGNVSEKHTSRYSAHLLMALLVIIWVCAVFFFELRAYIKIRQDYLTSAEHRLRASATTVLVNSIPSKWLSEEALKGLFDVFPGGIRNVWINKDLTVLLDKISLRDTIHAQLEVAETDLIKAAKKAQLKKKEADEKRQRKEMKAKRVTRKEKADRKAEMDAEAKRLASSGEGATDGKEHHIPHTIADEARESHLEFSHEINGDGRFEESLGPRSESPNAASRTVLKLGKGVKGAFTKAGNQVDALGTNNGFIATLPTISQAERLGGDDDRPSLRAYPSMDIPRTHSRGPSILSNSSTQAIRTNGPSTLAGNTVRKLDNIKDMYILEEPKFWQFWKTPAGGYASPVPQGNEAEDYMAKQAADERTFWQRFKESLPFIGGKKEEIQKYDEAHNASYLQDKEEEEAEWAKYLKKTDRPTHHLSPWGVTWLPGVPFITKKVDTIYWCREELARLNLEIEDDQRHPDRFPDMNSAFIQFNHQVAAHMACQSIIHHIPRHMAPRMNEISPRDVIWDNMALSWWNEWLRTAIVVLVVMGMCLLWAVPVAWTAALSQLDTLIQEQPWLAFLKDSKQLANIAKGIAGVLPAAVLALLLVLVPIILNFLAGIKGAKTGAQKSEFVQIFFFVFLFVQVFLVVSIASFFVASINGLFKHISELDTVPKILDILATNLPKAANYFFSYMILQAMSTSSGTLLQIGALFVWFILARMFDSTARNKWSRNTSLSNVNWGSFFPVYTNFACIALIYSVIAPLISVFAIITFSLLWIAQRYAMLYVNRFEIDTGGVLYPRAINQTFTGLYVMELCMAGLFFIVEDEKNKHTCTPHGAIMIASFFLTIIYQILLNKSFSPLFRYLPITIEDEAILRDEEFQRAQDSRFGLTHGDSDEDEDGKLTLPGEKSRRQFDSSDEIELGKMQSDKDKGNLRMRNPVKTMGNWAKEGGNQLRKLAMMDKNAQAAEYRRQQRRKDLESQRAIGEALYGGIPDEIEDLTPEERDMLTRHAFLHSALRARRPVVWIPRDDLGVSDDEVRRSQEYSEHIWISNEGTALDSKVRVVYGRHPPDFSEVDLINL
ncbi:putative RSN1-like protein [Cladobotryum mycophilum]|uniref:RSN1-like protein n=1 Tax=Cladobotryum mycophilum TaxID=491253 RepID=A0ABR0T2Y8_9HYPO